MSKGIGKRGRKVLVTLRAVETKVLPADFGWYERWRSDHRTDKPPKLLDDGWIYSSWIWPIPYRTDAFDGDSWSGTAELRPWLRAVQKLVASGYVERRKRDLRLTDLGRAEAARHFDVELAEIDRQSRTDGLVGSENSAEYVFHDGHFWPVKSGVVGFQGWTSEVRAMFRDAISADFLDGDYDPSPCIDVGSWYIRHDPPTLDPEIGELHDRLKDAVADQDWTTAERLRQQACTRRDRLNAAHERKHGPKDESWRDGWHWWVPPGQTEARTTEAKLRANLDSYVRMGDQIQAEAMRQALRRKGYQPHV